MAESAVPAQHSEFAQPTEITLGNLTLNMANYRVAVAGLPVDLSYHEFELLHLLATRPDRIIDFRDLAEALWQARGHREVRRLNVLVFRLRTKLVESRPYVIETVRGRGYGLVQRRTNGAAHG